MRPNLSLHHLAAVVAALGTSAVLAACTKADSAAVRSDQPQKPTPSANAAVAAPGEKKPDLEPTETATATATAAVVGGAASGRTVSPSRAPQQPAPNKGANGQASCGAGTCTSDPKKK